MADMKPALAMDKKEIKEEDKTRKKLRKQFKIRGYTLKVDALEEAISFVNCFRVAEDEAIDLLLDQMDEENMESSILDKEHVHRVVTRLFRLGTTP